MARDDASPQKQKMEIVEPSAEMKMTFVTLVRSESAESSTIPGTDAVLSNDTSREDSSGDKLIVRA